MTYTENVTAMAADWMAGVLSGDGPDALSPMVVTALPDPALPETGKRVIAAGRRWRPPSRGTRSVAAGASPSSAVRGATALPSSSPRRARTAAGARRS